KFQQAIQEAEELGEVAQDVIDNSKEQIPAVYWEMAQQKYATFQSETSADSADAAVAAIEEAANTSEISGYSSTYNRIQGLVTQLPYKKAPIQTQKKKRDEALATLDNVIERNANYAKAYYQKAIVTKNMDNSSIDEALQLFDKTKEVAESNGKSQMVTQA